MKRQLSIYALVFVFLACLNFTVSAEVSVSGNTQATATVLPVTDYTSDRFESLLNPGNIMDLHDLSLNLYFTAKISAEDDHGAFDFWFSIRPVGLPGLLLALSSASSNSLQETAALTEVFKSSDYDISGIDIQRADISWFISDSVSLTIGRQDLFTGYGYGWNPMNFAGTEKNPFNPKAELTGTNAASLALNIGNLIMLRASGIYDPENFKSGIDYNDLKAFAELTASFPGIEITIDGLYGSSGGDDSSVPAAGAGFMANIQGLGIYGEAALLKGSRIKYPDTAGNLISKSSIQFNGLAGLEYTFPWDMNGIFEYFYNGEGFNISDRGNYNNLVKLYSTGYVPFDIVSLMKPGYFAKTYCLLYLMQSFYIINSEASLSLMYSPDSFSLTIMPLFSFDVSGSLTVQAGYAGLFSLKENQYNEAYFSPVKHAVTLKAVYSF